MRTIRQSATRWFILPTSVLFSFLCFWSAADAALVNYSFTGGVSQVSGALLPTVNVMSPVSGTFTFNNNPATGGNYPGVVSGLTLHIGGYAATYAPGANAVTIFKAIDLGGGTIGDRWRLATDATGAAINGYTPVRFDLDLDREGSLFANTDMQNPPSLANLTGTRWRLIFDNGMNVVRIQGALNNLTAVPLPAAVLLFGAGLISLVGLGAGGMRNLRGTQA